MKVVRLGEGDAGRLLAASELFDAPPVGEAVRAYLADERNVVFLAVDSGRAVGFLRGTALNQIASARPQMFLYEIDVAPTHRRRGAGRALVRALLAYCRRHGFEEVFVFTDPANAAAVGLYRSTGAVTETVADRMFVYPLTRRPAGSRSVSGQSRAARRRRGDERGKPAQASSP